MPLFRPIPLPAASTPFTGQIEWAARRDPIGHRVHLCLACACLALIPLSSTLATIGSTALFIYTALRTPTIHRTWRPLFTNGCMLSLLGLYGWLATSLAWSSDPEHGLRLLRGSRYLLLVPALLPLMQHTRVLLGGLCAGVLIQLVAQQLVSRGTGGLSEHAGYTALWFTFAAMALVLTPPRGTGRGPDRIGKCLTPLVMAGIVVSTARSALLGCGVGLVLGMALAWLRNRVDRRAMVLSGVATIAVGVLLTLAPGSSMNRGMQEAFQAVNASDGSGVEAYPDQVRPLWWRIGFDAFTAAPVAGQGLGSAKTMIEGDAEVFEITRDGTVNQHAIRDDYHSLFVTVAADGGLVGLLLLAAWIILLGRQLLARGGELDAVLLGAFASFLVFSLLNTTAFSGRLVAFPAILMAFSIRSAPRQAGVGEATEGTT